jgi:RecA/RadA recombinase
MTDRTKDTITNKTTISIGILVLLVPIIFWAANVQADTLQSQQDIIELNNQDAEMLKEMRQLQDALNATNINMTKLNTSLEAQG